jgi:hypothetical protein
MRQGFLFLSCFAIVMVAVSGGYKAHAQALLPHITVQYNNGKNYLSWKSGYSGIKQIGVQRSQDSLFNYATIGHVSQPDKKVNQFVDNHPRPGRNYYRLFILLANNSYFFSVPANQSLEPATLLGATTSPEAFTPSVYVYTNPEGNVNISLAGADTKHYSIRFFDAQDHFLFALNDIQRPFLILDKSNFLRGGWYHYVLYEDQKVKEKWKFYVPVAAER